MMNLLSIFLLLLQASADRASAEDTGKFFVPVMVISVIFAGIAVYMLVIDRRLRKLEQKDKR